jgi:hypothetical protein
MTGSKTFALNLQDSEHDLLSKMLSEQEFSDVTLVSEDGITVQAHRSVLSACSEFFKEVFRKNPTKKMVMYVDNVNHSILKHLVHFIYTGQVTIQKGEFKRFLEIGEKFKISGLSNSENIDGNSQQENSDKCRETPRKIEESKKDDALEKENMHEPDILELNDKLAQMVEPKLEKDEEKLSESKDPDMNDEKRTRKRENYLQMDKKFHCEMCSFSAKFISALRIHIESVRESITYPCARCGQRFSQKSALFSHKRRVHEGIRFPCELCDYSASQNYKLKVHKAKKHSEPI